MERLLFLRRQHGFAVVLAIVLSTTLAGAPSGKKRTAEPQQANIDSALTDCKTFLPYSNDADDIWNRIQRALLVRTARDGSTWGCDEVDPLLWPGTVHVLAGDKYKQTMRLLDEFIAAHAEKRIRDPLKRAVFQRNLWGFFNWVVGPAWPGMTQKDREQLHFAERQELERRVAAIIKAVALSPEEIRRLPDNYAALRGSITADGLDLPDGDGWTLIGRDDGLPAATDHTQSFARSAFLVYLKLPEGTVKPAEYVEAMRTFSRTRDRISECDIPGLFDGTCRAPQFPLGTETALVRRAMLIDTTGQPVVSPIVESIQMRRYRGIPGLRAVSAGTSAHNDQQVAEFRLSQRALLAGSPSLRRIGEDEKDFLVFHSHGFDAFESRSHEARFFATAASQNGRLTPTHIALGCSGCHQSPGVGSFTSYSRAQFAQPKDMFVMVHASTEAQEDDAAVRAVKSQPLWKALEAILVNDADLN